MSSTQFLLAKFSLSFLVQCSIVICCLSLALPQGLAQDISYEGISLRIDHLAFDKVNVFDPESFNETMLIMLKDPQGKDIGTLSLSRMSTAEKTTVSTSQSAETKMMQNDRHQINHMDKGVGAWNFVENVKLDQHKAQYYELDSKIARKGKLFLIDTTKDQIVIKLVYKTDTASHLVDNLKDWITDIKVKINQSPRNN